MNKLALLGLLNSLGDDDFMWCLLDAVERDFSEASSFTFEYPSYVERAICEFNITVIYPDGQTLTTGEMEPFFGFVPAGTKLTTRYNVGISGSYYYLTKVDTK